MDRPRTPLRHPRGFYLGSSQQPNRFEGQGVQNAGHLAANRDINIIHNSHVRDDCKDDTRDKEQQDRERQNEHRRLLLESLQFSQMDARRISIKKAYGKTCRWFLKDPEYMQWSRQGGTHNPGGFLWIKGKPGAGKSTLMKLLLTQTRRAQPKNTLHFFFNARGEYLEKTTIGLYRSLLVQLLELHTGLQSILDRFPNDHHQWSVELLQELIEEAVEGLGEAPVICFIDALDECQEQEVREMISYLSELCEAGNRLHICFASRHYPHITINKGRSIILESREEHRQDIASYVDSALQIGPGKMVDEIKYDLQEKSSGVFMWVVLVVDILQTEYDKGGKHYLRERLRQIPGDLHRLFHEILTRDPNNTPGLLLCIQWVLFARQPLTPKQLYFAIISGVQPANLGVCHTEDITDDDIGKFLLNNSKGLAESTKSKSPTIQFIHESVRDFLLKGNGLQEVWPDAGSNIQGQSHEALKQACLAYLNSEPVADLNVPVPRHKAPNEEVDKARDDADGKLPFLEYANQGVLYHADMAQSGSYGQTEFLDSFPLARWVLYHNLFERHQIRRYTPTVSLRYVLAENNLGALIRAQSTTQSCLEVENERYGIPLFAALATKSANAVQALIETEQLGEEPNPYLENDPVQTSDYEDWCGAFSRNFSFSRQKGVTIHLAEVGDEKLLKVLYASEHFDAGSKDKKGCSPLHYAIVRRNIGVATVFIEQGTDVDSSSRGEMSPLLKALERDDIDMVRLLIKHGADLKSDMLTTPLYSAVLCGRFDIATLLIEHGADVNEKRPNGSPLSLAATKGDINMARLLIERDANVGPAWCETFFLAVAAAQGDIDMARLLIERGADINIVGQDGRTCLNLASAGGHIDTVKFLVDQGADINIVNQDGRTCLNLASAGGHIDTVKFLVDQGADINIVGQDGRTCLNLASAGGHIDTVKFLVDQGADINIVGQDGRTSLILASAGGYITIFKFLIERGANIDVVSQDGRTHLSLASAGGSIDIVKFLVDRGADVNERGYVKGGGFGEAPLISASTRGHVDVIKFLVKQGADVEGSGGKEPLAQASMEGHIDAVRILLDLGAKVDGSFAVSPRYFASARGHNNVVKLLDERGARR
ncbi:hypothetical protein PG990_015276 [Apiospora arundinis]